MKVTKSNTKVPCNDDFAHEWIMHDSIKYVFVRPAFVDEDGGVPMSQLANNESLFYPCGVYIREEDILKQGLT